MNKLYIYTMSFPSSQVEEHLMEGPLGLNLGPCQTKTIIQIVVTDAICTLFDVNLKTKGMVKCSHLFEIIFIQVVKACFEIILKQISRSTN